MSTTKSSAGYLSFAKFWLALKTLKTNRKIIAHIFQSINSWEKFCAFDAEKIQRFGLTEHQFSQICNAYDCPSVSAQQQLQLLSDWLNQSENHIIFMGDPSYPTQLFDIADPPEILFVRGQINKLNSVQLAMVGSRSSTPLGKDIAYRFANILSQYQLTVTSGLAYGIDAASHRGALNHAGSTIAVLGTGADLIYPKSHQVLADEIVEKNGAIVSDFWLGTPPKPFHFPRRNRLISGLSLGVIVVEANLRSGSLVTAKLAADQGREVFAVPGSIHSPNSKGCHALIKQGAKLVETIEDVLEEFRHLVSKNSKPEKQTETSMVTFQHSLTTVETEVFSSVTYDPVNQEDLLAITNLSTNVLLGVLTRLELLGLIESSRFGFVRSV